MDKFRQICAREAGRLKTALELARHAQQLAGYGQVPGWVDRQDVEALQKAREIINKKLPRLEKGEIHIAVVGSEKAGKSSFINAWLENDLLPNKQTRCTFTTTKLHSVDSADKQTLKVQPKTREEFEKLCETLEYQAAHEHGDLARNANDDLKMIRENRGDMEMIMANGNVEIPFATLDDIRDDLYKYAADAHYAHAIQQVDLYTTSLSRMDGILFYDVPGLDSGLSKHKQETEKMLADSDAVIVVKELLRPTIVDSEKQILEYARIGDESIPLKDKMFFFLSRIDQLATRQNVTSNLHDFLEPLETFGIDKNKVVVGAAPAVLYLKNRLRPEMAMVLGEREELKEKMQKLLDLPDTNDETIINAAGIREMREKIDQYLEHDLERIMTKSTNELVGQIETAARHIQDAVRKRVPENPTEVKRAHDKEINRAFEEFIEKFLENILAQLNQDLSTTLVEESVNGMNEAYGKLAAGKIGSLKGLEPTERDKFYSAQTMEYGQDYIHLNTELRKNVYDKDVLPLIRELSTSLSSDLHARLVHYMDSLSTHFNDSIDVRTIIMDYMDIDSPEAYRKHLESAMGALYLRYARPLSEALLRFRHGSKDRLELARRLAPTLQSLSLSCPDDAPAAYANLAQYVARGAVEAPSPVKQVTQAATKTAAEKLARKVTGGVVGGTMAGPVGAVVGAMAADAVIDAAASMAGDKAVCNSLEDVTKEVESDREALKYYLVNAIFQCSGIGEFADNEMGNIRRAFIASKGKLRADSRNAYDYNDPRFMELVPADLRQKECDTRVADLLHQLTMALDSRVSA